MGVVVAVATIAASLTIAPATASAAQLASPQKAPQSSVGSQAALVGDPVASAGIETASQQPLKSESLPAAPRAALQGPLATVLPPNYVWQTNGVPGYSNNINLSPLEGTTNTGVSGVVLTGGHEGGSPAALSPTAGYRYTVCVGRVSVLNGKCGSVAASIISPLVTGSWTIPDGVLAANTTYSWASVVVFSEYYSSIFPPTSAFSTGGSIAASTFAGVELVSPATQFIQQTLSATLTGRVVHPVPGRSYEYQFTLSLCGPDSVETCLSPKAVATSAWSGSNSWTVPTGALSWNGAYLWTLSARDNPYVGTLFNPYRTLATVIPLPANSQFGLNNQSTTVEGVNLSDLHYEESTIDASIPSVGTPLAVSRTYATTNPNVGSFGRGWSSVLDMQVTQAAPGYVVRLADYRSVGFAINPDGSYAPAPGSQGMAFAYCNCSGVGAKFTDNAGTEYSFDLSGRLIAVEDADGFKSSVTRDSAGKITRITDDTSGRWLGFAWTGAQVTSVTTNPAPSGVPNTWAYTYSNGQLDKVCGPTTSACTNYEYATTGAKALLKVTSPTGVVSKQLTYAASGKVQTARSDSEEKTFSSSTVPGGQSVAVSNAAGAVKTYALDALGRTIGLSESDGSTETWSFDYAGRLSLYTSPTGARISFQYEGGRLVSRIAYEAGTSPTGQVRFMAYQETGPAAGKMWMVGPTLLFRFVSDGTQYGIKREYDPVYSQNEIQYDSLGRIAKIYTGPAGFAGRKWTQYTYTGALEPAVGGGFAPVGLIRTMTDALGGVTLYQYDSKGSLSKITDPIGAVTSYEHDSLGRTTSTTHSGTGSTTSTVNYSYGDSGLLGAETRSLQTNAVTGQSSQFAVSYQYNLDGKVTEKRQFDSLSDATISSELFTYDARGRVETQSKDNGVSFWSYDYDAMGNVTSTTDPDGNETKKTYSPEGYLTSTIASDYVSSDSNTVIDLELENRTYDSEGRLLTRTDRSGQTYQYAYTSRGLLKSVTALQVPQTEGPAVDIALDQFEYNASGDVVREITPGPRDMSVLYDARGRPTKLTLTLAATPDAPASVRQVQRTYDLLDRVLEELVVDGAGTVLSRVAYTYDLAGNVLSRTSKNPDGTTASAVVYTRNALGLITSLKDPRAASNYLWSFSYDANGRVVTQTSPATAAASTGQVTTFGWNSAGLLSELAHPEGIVESWQYDEQGRTTVATELHEAGDVSPPATSYTYSPSGNLEAIEGPSGQTISYSYDSLGQEIERTLGVAQVGGSPRVWATAWSDDGLTSATANPLGGVSRTVRDTLGHTVSTSDLLIDGASSRDLTTSYIYDVQGNLAQEVSPGGAVSTSSYDAAGELVKFTDPDGLVTTISRDGLGRPIQTVNPSGATTDLQYDVLGNVRAKTVSAPGESSQVWAWSYDEAGNLVSATDPRGNAKTYGYDSISQVTSYGQEDGTSLVLTYDQNGNPTSVTDELGRVTSATYSPDGQIAALVEPATASAPSLADRTFTWSYDEAGLPVQSSRPGGNAVESTYDLDGNLLSQTATAGADVQTRAFSYDALGELATFSHPAGNQTLSYDSLGRLIQSSGPAGSATFGYDDDGRVVARSDDAGTIESTWSPGGRETTTTFDGLDSVVFGYDAAGRLGKETWSDLERTYAYDAFDRVVGDSITAGGVELQSAAYSYDLGGNRTSRSITPAGAANAGTTAYSYDERNRLTEWTDPSNAVHEVAWDDAGNATSIDGVTQVFNERNQLVESGGVSYTYSPDGDRTSAGSTLYTYDAFGQLANDGVDAYDYDALGRISTAGSQSFTYSGLAADASQIGGTVFDRNAGSSLLRIGGAQTLTDPHGDVVGTFDGSALTAYQYSPFGVPDVSGPVLGFQKDFTSVDGLVNMQSRWFDPATASFLTRDSGPLSLNEQNRYGYGLSNPVNMTDSAGGCATVVTAPVCIGAEVGSFGGPVGIFVGIGVGSVIGVGLGLATHSLIDGWVQGWAPSTSAGTSTPFAPSISLPMSFSWGNAAWASQLGNLTFPSSYDFTFTYSAPVFGVDKPAWAYPAEWVAENVAPVGVAASSFAAMCGAGGASCQAAVSSTGQSCVGAGASMFSACLPTVDDVLIQEGADSPGASAVPENATADPTWGTTHGGCGPNEVFTEIGCEDLLALLQRYVTKAQEDLSRSPDRVNQFLSKSEIDAATKNPWLEQVNNGKAMERLVSQFDEVKQFFLYRGGSNAPDFVGRSNNLFYELTTTNPSTVANHLGRWYVDPSRIAQYINWIFGK